MAVSEFSARSVGVAVACGIGAIISGASIILNSIGVLIHPIALEFGYSRTQISGVFIPAAAAAAIVTPLIGRAVDRWGGRRIVLVGVVLFSFSTMLVSITNGSLVELYVLYGLIGLTGTAAGAVAFNKVLSGWFQERRGLVLSLVGTGGAVGAAVVPKITFALLEFGGWRGSFIGLGVLVLVVGLPTFFFLFRDPPVEDVLARNLVTVDEDGIRISEAATTRIEGIALEPETTELPGVTTRVALFSPTLWLIIGAISINAMVGFGLQVHVMSLLTDRGVDAKNAVSVLSTFGVGGIIGQLSAGYLLDRFQTPRIALPFFISALAGLVIMSFGRGLETLIPAGLLLRIGVGAELSTAPYLLARFFGLKAFGEIYGLMYLIATIAGAAGPILMGICRDRTGSYNFALVIFEIAVAMSVVFIALLGPYVFAVKPPEEGEHMTRPANRSTVAGR